MPVGESANAPLLRLLNAQTAFDVVRREKLISRAQLARATGMAKPTVSNVLNNLQAVGLLRPTPGDRRRRGATFELVPTSALVFGLDVGGRYLRAGLAGLNGDVLATAEIEHTDVEDSELPRLAVDLRDRLLRMASADINNVEAAVVGVPGIVSPKNGRVTRLNPARVESYPIIDMLMHSLDSAVLVNDVNLAALGEQTCGLATDIADFVFLSIGTGVGAGLVLRGQLHPGRSGAAGEIDLPGDPESPSEPALLDYARTVYGRTPPAVETIFAASEQGDKAAELVVHEEARRIARQLVPIARVADVELVILGGGIGIHCGRILAEVSRQLAVQVHFPPRLAISALGDNAVLTGALALGVQSCGDRIVADRLRQGSPDRAAGPVPM